MVVLALAAGLLVGFVIWEDDGYTTPLAVTRFPIALPEGAAFVDYLLALSPDGTKLVHSALRGGGLQLYQRSLDQLESKPIPDTQGGRLPFFSPEGQWVGFHSEGALKKVSLIGGTPQTLCEAGPGRGSSWGRDGTIVFGQKPGCWRVSDTGGRPKRLTRADWCFTPQILPGGKAVVFERRDERPSSIWAHSLETGEEKLLVQRASQPRYVPTGHLLYTWDQKLLAVPFDLETLSVTGDSIQVFEGLWHGHGVGAVYGISETGTLAYPPSVANRLSWLDRHGRQQPVTEVRRDFSSVRLSPDGKRLGVTFGTDRSLSDLDL